MDAEQQSRDIPPCECGAEEGAFHELGCRWELCPFCGGTDAGGCECIYDHLGYRRRENPPECEYLPQSIYENGVDEAGRAEWYNRCAARGRLPYVYAPQTCARCAVYGQACSSFRMPPGSTMQVRCSGARCCANHASPGYALTSMRISHALRGCPLRSRSKLTTRPGKSGIRKNCVASILASSSQGLQENSDIRSVQPPPNKTLKRTKSRCARLSQLNVDTLGRPRVGTPC